MPAIMENLRTSSISWLGWRVLLLPQPDLESQHGNGPLQEGQQNSLSQPNLAQKGSCNKNPIILNDIVHQEFDYLQPFLSGRYALMAWFT